MDKTKTNAVIITHSADPDGIVSAAFIADMLESAGVTYELRFADYPNLTPVMEQAAEETGKSIYILDLALRTKRVPDEVIKPLLDNNEVHYFDHHELADRRRDLLEQGLKTFVSRTEKLCTARLIVELFELAGTEHRILADCAQGTDYDGTVGPELTALGTELAQAISPASGLPWESIVHTIKAGLHNHNIWRDGYHLIGELAEGAARTRKAMQVATFRIEESASYHTLFNGTDAAVVVAVAMADDSLYMMPGYQTLKQKRPDACVCFALYESGSVFAGPGLRSKEPPVPILKFLEGQCGGGRDNMGGFHYTTPTDIGNYEERRGALLQAYEGFLKQH